MDLRRLTAGKCTFLSFLNCAGAQLIRQIAAWNSKAWNRYEIMDGLKAQYTDSLEALRWPKPGSRDIGLVSSLPWANQLTSDCLVASFLPNDYALDVYAAYCATLPLFKNVTCFFEEKGTSWVGQRAICFVSEISPRYGHTSRRGTMSRNLTRHVFCQAAGVTDWPYRGS